MAEVSVSEKLELFSKTVFREASEQVNKMIREAEKERDDKILGASDKYLALAENRIEEEKLRIENEYVKLAAAESISANKEILMLRADLIDKVFENVKKKLEDFTATEQYCRRLTELCKKASEQMNGAIGQILLSKKDMKLAENILSQLPCGYSADEDRSIKLGGVRIRFDSENRIFDYSYENELSLARERFTHEDKLRLGD